MRRDDLLEVTYPDGATEPTLTAVADDEALDAIGRPAAFKHWLIDRCPDCDEGLVADPGACGEPDHCSQSMACRTCDGRGWKAKKGVWVGSYSDDEPIVIFPARWLEGDDQ